MGLFSARGRFPQAPGHKWPIRLHPAEALAQVAHTIGALAARLAPVARAAVRHAVGQVLAGLRGARAAAIAATNDARVVAVLLLLAAAALGVEMAASFHVI